MENTKIEWCDSSWNPVTGCYNNCPYCYARRIANRLKGCDNCPSGIHPSLSRIIELSHRLQATSKDGKKRAAAYPFGFTPTLHEYRLDDPQKKGFGKTVFVCSMADMFGPWVPDEWIKRVFQSCLDAPGHRYLFLTKYPIRYIELAEAGILPERDDFWYTQELLEQRRQIMSYQPRRVVIKNLEKRYVKEDRRNLEPTCPRCGRPFELEELLKTPWVNREFAKMKEAEHEGENPREET